MIHIAIEAHCLIDDALQADLTRLGITVVDASEAPWSVIFAGGESDLIEMLREHWDYSFPEAKDVVTRSTIKWPPAAKLKDTQMKLNDHVLVADFPLVEKVLPQLLISSIHFEVTPLPDDEYEVRVRRGDEATLRRAVVGVRRTM